MDASRVAALPPRPADLAEWEDLLVRFEIMARALRVTLEEAAGGADATLDVLRGIVRDDTELARWLHGASTGEAADAPPPPAAEDPPAGDPRRLADRFVSLRARNFAMLQRRGIEVWEWTAPFGDAGWVTAYQMVTGRVAADAEALRELREGIRTGAAAC